MQALGVCDVEISNVLLFIGIPVLVCVFLLSVFIFFSNRQSAQNRNLGIVVFLFFSYIALYLTDLYVHDLGIHLLAERLLVMEAFIFPFLLFFAYAISEVKLDLKHKLFYTIPFLPFLFLSFTDYSAYVSNVASCEVSHGLALQIYLYAVAIIYILWALSILIISYRQENSDSENRQKIGIVIIAIFFLLCWVGLFKLLGGILNVDSVERLGEEFFSLILLGVLITIGIVTYAIVRYHLVQLKLVSVRVTTLLIIMLVAVQYLFVDGAVEKTFVATTFFAVLLMGIIRFRSFDIEARHASELEHLNRKLKRLDEAKSDFISLASHQLRTPLTTMKGYLDMMQNGIYGKPKPEMRDALAMVNNSNERLIGIVEDLLNVSRVESGKLKLEMQSESAELLLAELHASFLLVAKQKKLKLILKLPKRKLPHVLIDKMKIREVISNLIDNAIKYTVKGNVTISAARKAGMVCIEVSDTGLGIQGEDYACLFEKYSRGKTEIAVRCEAPDWVCIS
jgi:signal transduction histidine kinase